MLREAVGHLAYLATERHYREQPELWELGEHGRARTLEDYTHHFRHLAPLDERVWRHHRAYCYELFEQRGFPRRWLDDAWRIMRATLREHVDAAAGAPALSLLERADQPSAP
jgi:hypothetical protein